MRIEAVPEEIKRAYLIFRVICGALLAGLVVYVVVMILMAGESHSVWEYPGSSPDADPADHDTVVTILAALAAVEFVAAFVAQAFMLKRTATAHELSGRSLPDTPVGRAFAVYRSAKIVAMGLAESVATYGLVVFIIAGRFTTFAVPALLTSAVGMIVLFPTEANLLEYLDERLASGDEGSHGQAAGPHP